MDEHYVEAYTRKQKCINHGLQIIDEDIESDDEEESEKIGFTNNQKMKKKINLWINKEDWI